jgi:hypothetical protein
MNDDPMLMNSPLQQHHTSKGHIVEICIYKLEQDTEWVLEVLDGGGTSTVWDDKFPTDKAALEEALRSIEVDGVEGFLTETLPTKLHYEVDPEFGTAV